MPTFAYLSTDVIGGCDGVNDYVINNGFKFRPVYSRNQHVCNPGYFLPANTDGCRACPAGYTCNGGTFSFNEQIAQGIEIKLRMTQNVSNACAVNLVYAASNNTTKLRPVFVPNETITVIFNNGETTETVTCVYDTALTLPEPPTRVGYIFAGWKVHSEQ